jgi:methionyl-tRNA formyltransferase
MLRFHPADIRNYRGLGPPQAFLDGKRQVGLTLQRLNDEIDAGEIVAIDHVDVSDCNTLWDIYEVVHELQVTMLASGLQAVIDPSDAPIEPESLGRYYSIKNRREFLFAWRVLSKNIRGHIRKY